MMRIVRVFKAPRVKPNVAKVLCFAACVGIIAILSGCQPVIPPGTTFESQQPRWSWTGTWRGSGGSVFNIVQEGGQWVASGMVSGVATINGNRAVGHATDGIPRTFEFVMSDDGMFAKGTVTVSGGIPYGAVLTRISGPPQLLSDDVLQAMPRTFAAEEPNTGNGGWLGLAVRDWSDGIDTGALVVQVEPGSPAALADIRAGDILELYDDNFEIEGARHFLDSMQKLPAGSLVTLELARSGDLEIRTVELGTRPAQPRLSNGPSIASRPATENSARPAGPIHKGHSGDVLTVDEYNAIKRDNSIAAEARFKAMGVLTLQGRVEHVHELYIDLAGEDSGANSVHCDFNRVGGRIIPPPAAMQLHKDDLVTIRGRVGANYFTTSDLGHCEILDIIPAAQAPHATTRVPAPGMIPAAPRGASAPPAGYYQCYSLSVLSSANYCDRGDLQLDGAGNYATTIGSAGRYVFDAGASVVSFVGGVLDGRQGLADRIKDGTFRIRMRKSGEGLPSPKQGFGIYAYEHRPSGRRTKP